MPASTEAQSQQGCFIFLVGWYRANMCDHSILPVAESVFRIQSVLSILYV